MATTRQTASEYLPLIVRTERRGGPLPDVAEVVDSGQGPAHAGLSNGKPSVIVLINRQPNAIIMETADRVRDLLPVLQRRFPAPSI